MERTEGRGERGKTQGGKERRSERRVQGVEGARGDMKRGCGGTLTGDPPQNPNHYGGSAFCRKVLDIREKCVEPGT